MDIHLNFFKTYSGLPKSIYVIFFARVVNTIGNFVFPFMTLLLTTKIGMGEQTVGKYLILVAIVQIPGSLLGGKLSDHVGRKKTAITFMILAALCLVPCAFLVDSAAGIVYVPWFLILTTFFNSIVGPTNSAMMNDLTTPENRKQAFSLLYMGMNAGTAIGSIVAGFMFNNFMKLLFIGDVITSLIAIVILAKYVKETIPTRHDISLIGEERVDEKVEDSGLFRALLKRPRLLVFAALNTVYAFIYAQTGFSLPLQAKSVFGVSLGAQFYGTFNMINCVEVIVLTTFIAFMTRKIRSAYNVSIAGVFFAVGFGMLFIARNFWLFALSTVIWTVGEIIHATSVGVYLANHTPISHRGRFSAIINIISGVGHAISPYVMGTLIAGKGVVNVWPVIFVLSMIAALSMFILGSTEKNAVEYLRSK
jgi:MFS family permease